MAKSKSQMRALLRGVSDKTSGPKVTADPRKASKVRDPMTGRRFERGSPVFKKMEDRASAP
jgi:hypothetical protein